jgi:hypothetical protein
MDYELFCEGATSDPVITGTVVDACTTAGGTVVWLRADVGFLPELTLAEGGQIAGAILGLWALAFCIRAIRKQVEES